MWRNVIVPKHILVQFWPQNRFWRWLSFYVVSSDTGVLAVLAGLVPALPARKHFPDV
jgi:anti-sigma-K factor RskA